MSSLIRLHCSWYYFKEVLERLFFYYFEKRDKVSFITAVTVGIQNLVLDKKIFSGTTLMALVMVIMCYVELIPAFHEKNY